MKGYISKAELNDFIKRQVEKDKPATPITLEIWKDEEDYRDCFKGTHLIEIELDDIINQTKNK